MPTRRRRQTPPSQAQSTDFDLSHPALETSPSVQRFLASVPPSEKEQCLRAALVYGIRHFLTLQTTQNAILNYSTMRSELGPTDVIPTTIVPVRRPVQPGRTLAAFPFVDESRFETRSLLSCVTETTINNKKVKVVGVVKASAKEQNENESINIGSTEKNFAEQAPPPPPPSVSTAPKPPTENETVCRPKNVVFASYPNWWPLENVVTAANVETTTAASAAAKIAVEATTSAVEQEDKRKSHVKTKGEAKTTTAAKIAVEATTASVEQEDNTESNDETKDDTKRISVASTFNPNEHPPTRTEIPWKSNDRPPLWEPKHRVERLERVEIDESLLAEGNDVSKRNYYYKPFKARKIPIFKKRDSKNGRKYDKVRSKIGSEVKQYRIAARRAKIRSNEATDRVMKQYADGVDNRGKTKDIEAATLASAIVDSGIMADLLTDVPGPSIEIFPAKKTSDINETIPSFESIMREIELEAAMESESPERKKKVTEFQRRNYSSWVGDFGPPHTRTRMLDEGE